MPISVRRRYMRKETWMWLRKLLLSSGNLQSDYGGKICKKRVQLVAIRERFCIILKLKASIT